ncbi:MAG: hypothetical protein U9N47_05955, partial [Thermodesulfobacteriota bacterium]|nr:hypothetical protein [Thermodesulfobacteriota bacterium]
MEPIYFVAIISFISGSFGYIILQFWVRPILGYRKIKNKVALTIKYYNKSKDDKDIGEKIKSQMKEWSKANRQNSVELSASYNENLPNWYKMLLDSRGESPIDASRHLMVLSNIRNYYHAEKHIEGIKKYLKIK